MARVRGVTAASIASQSIRKDVAVVDRLDDDHLVARAHDREHRGEDRLRGAGGHGDLGVGVVATSVEAFDLGGDRLAQRRYPGHRRVLVQSSPHRVGDRVDQFRVAVEVGEALPQVDRAALGGEGGHHGEDRRADLRHLGLEDRGGGQVRGVHGVSGRSAHYRRRRRVGFRRPPSPRERRTSARACRCAARNGGGRPAAGAAVPCRVTAASRRARPPRGR